MVNGIKGSGQVKKAEAGDLLTGYGMEEMVVESKESGFCGMEFGVS